MNLKLRFALFFTFFVAVILVISSSSIYFLYYNYRSGDYYKRLQSEARQTVDEFIANRAFRKGSGQMPHPFRKDMFSNENLLILDSAYNVLFKDPDSYNYTSDEVLMKNIFAAPGFEYKYQIGERDCIGLYIEKQKLYVLISAVDQNGLRKLSTLQTILAAVFLGGILLTSIMSFFFVQHAFKPLAKLSLLMKSTTEMSLSERLDEPNGRNELNSIVQNFNGMLERLNEAFESQKSFVHHASHELRTPLATMLAQTEAALRKDLSIEEYRQVLQSLKEDQEGLVDLSNSLLLLSQYERIQSANKWPPIRIDEVLYDTMSNARKMLSPIEIELQFAQVPDDEKDLMVKGNEALLKVAFTNLIKNAWQYSADKKVMITIETSGQHVIVHFDNNGDHLSESEIDKLKVPFFRGSNAVNVKGFGLGLSIVQRIMLLHHGSFGYTIAASGINRFTAQFTNAGFSK